MQSAIPRPPPPWLVTGGSGFLGRHLLAALVESADLENEVLAVGRRCPAGWPSGAFVRADLESAEGLTRAIAPLGAGVVFHLAGRTPPADPAHFYRANTLATAHLLEVLRRAGRPARVVLAGSAAERRPVGAYALSKWFATAAGRAARPPLEVVVARVFNPIGPGLPPSQAFGRFAALLSAPGPDPLRLPVGDLHARRDFIAARDVAEALIALARCGQAGRVYEVGTGRSHRVGEGLEHLIRLSGRRVEVEAPPFGQGPGSDDSRADIGPIVAETGWAPRIAFERSLAALWDDARSRADLALTAPAPTL